MKIALLPGKNVTKQWKKRTLLVRQLFYLCSLVALLVHRFALLVESTGEGKTVHDDLSHGKIQHVVQIMSSFTAAQAAVCGQLQGSLGAVPAVPSKLVLALFDAALGPRRHAAGIDQVRLHGRHNPISP